ncbi:type II CAAX endopeptidase family protein [Lactovum odontotermitis]
MMKRTLLNIPILLGLVVIDLITPNVERAFTRGGHSLSPLQIVIVAVVSVLSIAYFVYWGKTQKYAEWSFKNFWKNKGKIILGLLSVYAALIVVGIIMAGLKLEHTVSANQQTLNGLVKLEPFLLIWFTTAIAAPIMEETIFRLGIFKLLFPDKDKIALVVSAILFAGAHMTTEITNFTAWLPYLAAGLILGFLYYKTKKIEVTVSVHVLWNTLSMIFSALLMR